MHALQTALGWSAIKTWEHGDSAPGVWLPETKDEADGMQFFDCIENPDNYCDVAATAHPSLSESCPAAQAAPEEEAELGSRPYEYDQM